MLAAQHPPLVVVVQERKGHINLRKSRDTGPGVPRTPGGTNTVYRPVSQGLLVNYFRKTDKFAGTPSQGHPVFQQVFRIFM